MTTQPFVLIVEDAEELSGVFAEVLEVYGMTVKVIDDGADAMAWLAQGTPDLILLDMHLPHVSGLEILAYVRGADHLQNTKVVAVTGNALLTPDLEDKADLVLLKPITLSQLCELSTRLLHASVAA